MVDQWGTIGFPRESRLLALYYEPESGQFLAHLSETAKNGQRVKSVYARKFSEKTYRPLAPAEDGLSYESLLVCPESAKVLANVFRVKNRSGSHAGMEWDSIREIDAEKGTVTTVLASDGLEVEAPYSRAWVSRLRKVRKEFDKARLTAESAGDYESEPGFYTVRGGKDDELLCTVSFRKKKGDGDADVEDYVCKVSPSSGHYRKITKLPHSPNDPPAQDNPASRAAV